jgi:hypothetical protein
MIVPAVVHEGDAFIDGPLDESELSFSASFRGSCWVAPGQSRLTTLGLASGQGTPPRCGLPAEPLGLGRAVTEAAVSPAAVA